VRYWRGYLSGARCKRFAYGAADATTNQTSVASLKPRIEKQAIKWMWFHLLSNWPAVPELLLVRLDFYEF